LRSGVYWRLILIIAAAVVSIIFFLPTTHLRSSLPDALKKYGLTLGLDLQGGIHLVYEVDTDKAVEITTERIVAGLSNILREKGINAEVKREAAEISIASTDEKIKDIVSAAFPNLELMNQSSGALVYGLSDKEKNNIKNLSVEQALETIRNRVDQFGVAEPTIHAQASNEIVVQLPGIKDAKRAVELVGRTAILEFKLLDDESPLAAQLPESVLPGDEERLMNEFKDKIPPDDEVLFGRFVERSTGRVIKKVYLVKKQTLLTGDVIKEARVNIDQRFNEPYVGLSFNSVGARLFEDITANNVKRRLAIILDNNVYSAPVIQERIGGGNAQITGTFSMDEAKDLAIVLRSGSLPAPLKMLQNVTVGPSLGQDSIDAGKLSGIIAFISVVVFMVFYYRLSGVIADFALILNILLLLGVLSAFRATLTLPGIAGIILAIGMAVDSNVLMFERIREELRLGKTPKASIDSGYKKAFWTIFDSHVTTLITAAILFQFGTGPIKGFAVTLGWGVFINLFTAFIGTKTIFDIIVSRKEIKKISI